MEMQILKGKYSEVYNLFLKKFNSNWILLEKFSWTKYFSLPSENIFETEPSLTIPHHAHKLHAKNALAKTGTVICIEFLTAEIISFVKVKGEGNNIT